MSVLRDATCATLGARASLRACRDTRSHFEVAYDGVARLARPHMRTCICVFSSRRACAVSAFFTFGPLGPHTRQGPFPRSFSSLPIFVIFFYATIPQKFQERTARASSMSAPHTSYLIRHIKRARRAPPPLPRAPHQATQAHHPHRLSRPFLAPLALSSIHVFYYSTLHSCLSSPCPTRDSLVAFCRSPWFLPWRRWR